MQVITYGRVSSEEQALGFSLRNQKAILETYCSVKGFSIIKHYDENYSGKNFDDRPAFNELLKFVKQNKKTIDALYVTRWDRFSRNLEAAFRIIRIFNEMGISINSVEQPLDLTQSDTKVLLALYLVLPEIENNKNSQRTSSSMYRGKIEGAWMGSAPIGFLHDRTSDGKSTLKPNLEIAPIIKKVFQEYASGIYSTEEVRKKYYHKGLKISKNGMLHLLKNHAYCGKIFIKEYKKQSEIIVEGLHQGIISVDIFEKVQKQFLKKQVKPILEPSQIDEILPLRGFLKCHVCGKTLTGSGSMGGGVTRHFYYHCTRHCKTRFKMQDVHTVLESLLKEFVINDNCKEVYKKVLDKTFKTQAGDRETQLKSLKREINKLQVRLDSIEEKFFDDQIDSKTYNSSKRKTEIQIANLKSEIETISSIEKDFDLHLKKGISFLQKIDVLYQNASSPIKKKLLASIFPEKLIFETAHFKTPYIDEFIGYILFNNKKLKYLKVDKSTVINFNFKQKKTFVELEI